MWTFTQVLPILVRLTCGVPTEPIRTRFDRALGIIDLVLAAFGLQLLHAFVDRQVIPRKRPILRDDLGHRRFDRIKVIRADRPVRRHGHVVIEPFVQWRAVHQLNAGNDALDRLRHHVGAAMTNQQQRRLAGLAGLAIDRGDQRKLGVLFDQRAGIAQFAVDLRADDRLGQAGPDVGRDLSGRHRLVVGADGSVR